MALLTRDLLDDQQRNCVAEMVKHKRLLVLGKMGSGKTICSLTAVSDLLDDFEISSVLVVAPKFVALSTWSAELKAWAHLRGLTITVLAKETKASIKITAREDKADIHVISTNLFDFLVEELLLVPRIPNKDPSLKPSRQWKLRDDWREHWRYGAIVFDEAQALKNPTASVSQSAHIAAKCVDVFYGLSGTLSGGNPMSLWSPMMTMDFGRSLGHNITAYRYGFFNYNGYSRVYTLMPGAKEAIGTALSKYSVEMVAPDRPYEVRTVIHKVELPKQVMTKYKEFEKEFLIELTKDDVVIDYQESIDDADEFEAQNAAVLSGKLRQMASGTLIHVEENENEFDDTPPVRKVVPIHDIKLKKLDEIMQSTDESLLIFYWFKGDYDRLKERYGDDIVMLRDAKSIDSAIALWNAGKIKYFGVQPCSAGHGLNLQHGGRHNVWFSLPAWSSERWEQACARLDRRGQLRDVFNHVIMAKGTIDETEYGVVLRKMKFEEDLIRFISNDIKRRKAEAA